MKITRFVLTSAELCEIVRDWLNGECTTEMEVPKKLVVQAIDDREVVFADAHADE